jgi:4'-phosphopantetheinyl transferase
MKIALHEIHIWSYPLILTTEQLNQHYHFLSEDEKNRAQQFSMPLMRQRFIAARGFLRQLLGAYLALAPSSISFSYTAYKKPGLAQAHQSDLRFNLSHTDDLALYAFRLHHEIGVDIEKIRPSYSEAVAKRIFSVEENKVLNALPPAKRHEAFYCLWSRKEAVIKAVGKGIFHLSHSLTLSPQPIEEKIQLENKCWTVIPLTVSAGYTASMATDPSFQAIHYMGNSID